MSEPLFKPGEIAIIKIPLEAKKAGFPTLQVGQEIEITSEPFVATGIVLYHFRVPWSKHPRNTVAHYRLMRKGPKPEASTLSFKELLEDLNKETVE